MNGVDPIQAGLNKIPFDILNLVDKVHELEEFDPAAQERLQQWAKAVRKRISKEGVQPDWWHAVPKGGWKS